MHKENIGRNAIACATICSYFFADCHAKIAFLSHLEIAFIGSIEIAHEKTDNFRMKKTFLNCQKSTSRDSDQILAIKSETLTFCPKVSVILVLVFLLFFGFLGPFLTYFDPFYLNLLAYLKVLKSPNLSTKKAKSYQKDWRQRNQKSLMSTQLYVLLLGQSLFCGFADIFQDQRVSLQRSMHPGSSCFSHVALLLLPNHADCIVSEFYADLIRHRLKSRGGDLVQIYTR